MAKEIPIVSKRNDFSPADELVEEALMFYPYDRTDPKIREWLLKLTESTIRRVAYHFATGAQRGIEQTANLLCNPEFYETRRRRRENWRRKMAEDEAKREQERLERRTCPTAQQINETIARARKDIDYHEKALARSKEILEQYQKMEPRNIRAWFQTKESEDGKSCPRAR